MRGESQVHVPCHRIPDTTCTVRLTRCGSSSERTIIPCLSFMTAGHGTLPMQFLEHQPLRNANNRKSGDHCPCTSWIHSCDTPIHMLSKFNMLSASQQKPFDSQNKKRQVRKTHQKKHENRFEDFNTRDHCTILARTCDGATVGGRKHRLFRLRCR